VAAAPSERLLGYETSRTGEGELKMTADRLLQIWGSMVLFLIWIFLISLIAFNIVPWWVAILGAIVAQLNELIFLAIVRRVLHLETYLDLVSKTLADKREGKM
jgi:hypothetical protein